VALLLFETLSQLLVQILPELLVYLIRVFFPGFWKHDPFPWNWEFSNDLLKIGKKTMTLIWQ
jgi:hypothetical protein